MRLNPIILLISLLVGLGGIYFGVRAFTTYDDAAEAFTRIELAYVPGSFEWQDSEYEYGTATFRLINDSRFLATVDSFSISLYFDGDDFAGTDYETERFQEMRVPGHETREMQATFEVTANSIQDRGGTAELSFAGQLLVRFEEFEQPLSFRFRGTIGQVEFDAS